VSFCNPLTINQIQSSAKRFHRNTETVSFSQSAHEQRLSKLSLRAKRRFLRCFCLGNRCISSENPSMAKDGIWRSFRTPESTIRVSRFTVRHHAPRVPGTLHPRRASGARNPLAPRHLVPMNSALLCAAWCYAANVMFPYAIPHRLFLVYSPLRNICR